MSKTYKDRTQTKKYNTNKKDDKKPPYVRPRNKSWDNQDSM